VITVGSVIHAINNTNTRTNYATETYGCVVNAIPFNIRTHPARSSIIGIAKVAIPFITKMMYALEGCSGIALPAMHGGWRLTLFAPAVADGGIARCVKKFMPGTKPARIIWLYSLTVTSLSIFSGFRTVDSGHARNVENTSRGTKVVRTTGVVVSAVRDEPSGSRTAETIIGVALCATNNIRPPRIIAITAGIWMRFMRLT
jgi:hypothetical protein